MPASLASLRPRSFRELAQLIILASVILLAALSLVLYALTRDATVLLIPTSFRPPPPNTLPPHTSSANRTEDWIHHSSPLFPSAEVIS